MNIIDFLNHHEYELILSRMEYSEDRRRSALVVSLILNMHMRVRVRKYAQHSENHP